MPAGLPGSMLRTRTPEVLSMPWWRAMRRASGGHGLGIGVEQFVVGGRGVHGRFILWSQFATSRSGKLRRGNIDVTLNVL